MLFSSAIIFTCVITNGLIAALPNNDHNSIESSSNSISLEQSSLFSESSEKAFSSRQIKRGMFRMRNCDGRYYTQAKVQQIGAKICKQTKLNAPGTKKSSASTRQPTPYIGPKNLFPHENKEKLTMLKITNQFFPFHKIKLFAKYLLYDYMVFAENCRPVGVVRKYPVEVYILCSSLDMPATGYPVPTAPNGANNNYIVSEGSNSPGFPRPVPPEKFRYSVPSAPSAPPLNPRSISPGAAPIGQVFNNSHVSS
ncbi:hypothetical protein HI914_06367 [Erysiphe necator]|nr:hypothetical protein HI914_06367 [Erysiphe necator]